MEEKLYQSVKKSLKFENSGETLSVEIYYESPGQRLCRWASLLAHLYRHWTGKPV